MQKRKKFSPRAPHLECAAVMVELVIVFPIALLMVSALIDFGMAAHRSEQIAEIARQAARLATIVSFEDDTRPIPDQYTCPASPPLCEESSGWAIDCLDQQSLSCLALTEAHNAMVGAGIDPSDWIIKSRICDIAVVSDSKLAVQVEIAPNSQSRACWICFGNYLGAQSGTARSLFAVEGVC